MESSPPSMSRREFAVLSAATAGALLSPTSSTAKRNDSITSESVSDATTDLYEFLLDRVESDFSLPTLIRFDDDSGFAALDDLDVQYRTHSGEATVAHANLTPDQARQVGEQGETVRMEYSPGSNPFWKLAAYEDGVFLEPEDSVDFIAFDEALAGLEHLENEHPSRLNVETVGEGGGHYNHFEERDDPRAVWAVELTENVSDPASFEAKEKLVFSMSIHGDERAGVEAGLRFVEGVLEGEFPEVEDLLSEFVLVFVSSNPDGWVVRERVYEDPVDPRDFRRFNSNDYDLNRQFPTVGWISPDNRPAEPSGGNLVNDTPKEIDDDVPERVSRNVPAPLAIVDHLRSYQNVSYFLDLHGMYAHTNAVVSITEGGFGLRTAAEMEVWNRTIESELTDALGGVEEFDDTFQKAIDDTDEQIGCQSDFFCRQPVELFGYGSAVDTIGYTGTGFLGKWVGAPEEHGGLGIPSITLEIVFSNSVPDDMERRFIPELASFHVAAYQAACRATVEHASDEAGVALETGGRRTAYVQSESLTRSAADLEHFDPDDSSTNAGGPPAANTGDAQAEMTSERTRHSLEGTATSTTVEIPEGTHTVEIEVRTSRGEPVETVLRSDDGGAARRRPPRASGLDAGKSRYTLVDPDPGEWTLEIQPTGASDNAEIRVTRLETTADTLNPDVYLGYQQRNYEVTPLSVFEELAEYADGPIEPLSVDKLRGDELVRDGSPRYDSIIVSHDDIDGRSLGALAEFVDAGGNLVLTDAGLELAGEMDVAGLDTVESVSHSELSFAHYGRDGEETDRSHPLFLDVPETDDDTWVFHTEPYSHPLVGYATDETPAHELDRDELDETAVNVGFETEGDVRLSSVPTVDDRTGVQLLGTLLPPPTQHNLHPFGLDGHSLTFFGYQLLSNALGYELSISRNGQQVERFGAALDVRSVDPDELNGETEGDGGNRNETETGTGTGMGTDNGGDSGTPPDSETADDGTLGSTVDDETSDSADDDGVGFGLPAGLTGLAGAGYLLSRRANDEDGETSE